MADYNSIQKLQAGLSLLGYDIGKIDGDAGKDTNAQIRKFLKDNKINGVSASNLDAVLEKVRLKTLADPKAQERLTEMARDPAALTPEGVKVLQGGLALKDIRTGAGHDRITIDGVAGPLTTKAVTLFNTPRAQAWKENCQEISHPATTAAPAIRTAGLTGDNRSVAERRADYYLDTVIPEYSAKRGYDSPFLSGKNAEQKREIRNEIVKYESITIMEKDALRFYNQPGNPMPVSDLKNRIAIARESGKFSEEEAVIKGAEGHVWAGTSYHERPVMDHVEQDIRSFRFQEVYGRHDRISELTDKPSWAPFQIQDYHYSRHAAVNYARESMKPPSLWDRARGLLPISATETPLPTSKNGWGADQLIDERQHPQARRDLVNTIIPDAAKATKVSAGYMRSVWGLETDFSRDIVSKSGCMGSWQFEKRTFAAVLGKYGDRIVSDLREKGLNNLADKVELHAKEMKGLGNVWEAPGSKITNEEMQAMRFDPRISTLAAGYLNAENARALKIDLNDRANWGTAYSAYNLGVRSTKTLRSEHWRDSPHVMGQIKAAVTNETFFINPLSGLMDATGAQVLGNYETKILAKEREYNIKFGPSARQAQPASYASALDSNRLKTDNAGKPLSPMEDFRTVAWNTVSDDGSPQKQRLAVIKEAGQELTQNRAMIPRQPTLNSSTLTM